jgi:predicted permease
VLTDVRLAARLLLQSKTWTAVILVSLALGIGANTALFSAINGLLIRKVPVRDPDALVRFRYAGPNQVRTDVLIYGFSAPDARGREVEPTFSYPMYREFVADNRTLVDLIAWAPIETGWPFGRVNVVVDGRAEVATGLFASGNYYRLLGVNARMGRTIVPDDDRPTAAPVAVISGKYWIARFGARPDIVGLHATINNVPLTIVGVLPQRFTGVDRTVADAPDIAVPLALEPQINVQPSTLQPSLLTAPNFWWLHVMGRLKPGATLAQVRANFGGVFQHASRDEFERFVAALPADERAKSYLQDRSDVPELLVDSGSRGVYDVDTSDLRAVTVLAAVVALILLLVCANVANLLLSRATVRQKELSIRLALGATRWTLVRQLLTESVVLAAMGGALALVVARWGRQLLPAPAQTTGFVSAYGAIDWHVLLFIVSATIATAVVFGAVPALRATRDINHALKEHARTAGDSRSRLGKSLVIVQVTISVIVLVGAGLFLRTLQNLRHVDVGFNPNNVVIFRVSPALNRYEGGDQNRLYERIGARLQTIGGVTSVAWSNPGLMWTRRFSTDIFVNGRVYARGRRDTISQMVISPGFFETMEIPLVAGRGFTAADNETAPQVVVINEAAARTYFPNESPLGRRFGSSPETSGRLEIIGILRDAKYNSVRGAAVPTVYRPYRQAPAGTMTFEVRTSGDPLASVGTIRDAVRQVDPGVPLIDLTTQTEEIERRFGQEKMFAQAYALFGALALVVAAVGLFGLMSYSVARRTYEIGVRMALGAASGDVLRLVMRESMRLVSTGVALGLAGAVATSRLVANLLYGVAPADPIAAAGAVTVMLLVSAAAGYVPARRASRVDPLTALRYE